jgi:hypothetical protein
MCFGLAKNVKCERRPADRFNGNYIIAMVLAYTQADQSTEITVISIRLNFLSFKRLNLLHLMHKQIETSV